MNLPRHLTPTTAALLGAFAIGLAEAADLLADFTTAASTPAPQTQPSDPASPAGEKTLSSIEVERLLDILADLEGGPHDNPYCIKDAFWTDGIEYAENRVLPTRVDWRSPTNRQNPGNARRVIKWVWARYHCETLTDRLVCFRAGAGVLDYCRRARNLMEAGVGNAAVPDVR